MTPSRVRPVRLAGSSRARAVAVHPVLFPPPLGVHNGHVPGLQGLQGPLVRRTVRHGGVRPSRRWSTCTPRRCETLYVTPRPTQTRPARSARTWWPCTGRSYDRKVVATQGGWHPAERASRTARCARRGLPACSGGSPGCVGRLRRVSSGARTREPHFGGRHRTSSCRVRCLWGTCPSEPHSYR